MADDNTPNPNAPSSTDASSLMVGLALGVAFGSLINNLAVGIGTGLALGAAANMARRKGSSRWMLWLALYSIIVLIAFTLRLTGVLK